MKYELKLKCMVKEYKAGKTLLSFICERFSYHNPEYWETKIAEKQILLNGLPSSSETMVKENDEIEFIVPNFEEPDLDMNYKTIWESEDLLLVSKPSDLPVHSTRRIFKQTLTAAVRKDVSSEYLQPLHRLDRETSGLIFYVKNPLMHKKIHKKMKSFFQEKFYLAIVKGKPDWIEKTISQPLKECLSPPVKYKMIIDSEGKEAVTRAHLISSENGISLILLQLFTGRKHQIRAHLASEGYPIIGDKLYSHNSEYFLKRCEDRLCEEDLQILGSSHHLLHALSLKIQVPGEIPHRFYSFNFSEEMNSYLKFFPKWENEVKTIIEQPEARQKNDITLS